MLIRSICVIDIQAEKRDLRFGDDVGHVHKGNKQIHTDSASLATVLTTVKVSLQPRLCVD